MDVEARGQVGGLDADVETRRQLAKSSGSFMCANCGKSNSVIMEEQARLVAELGRNREEEKVPEELRLAYKEDLGKKEDQAPAEAMEKEVEDEPTPALLRRQPEPQQRDTTTQPEPTPTIQIQQQAQARPAGSEDVWLEMGIWFIGAILAILVARKVLMSFFT